MLVNAHDCGALRRTGQGIGLQRGNLDPLEPRYVTWLRLAWASDRDSYWPMFFLILHSDIRGAGTDARVSIIIFGAKVLSIQEQAACDALRSA